MLTLLSLLPGMIDTRPRPTRVAFLETVQENGSHTRCLLCFATNATLVLIP